MLKLPAWCFHQFSNPDACVTSGGSVSCQMLVLSVEVFNQPSDADSAPALFDADIVPAEALHDLSNANAVS
jgi:hypothetical protein